MGEQPPKDTGFYEAIGGGGLVVLGAAAACLTLVGLVFLALQ